MNINHFIFTIIVVQGKSSGKFCEITGDDPTKECYLKETLLTMTHSPHQLALDRQSNTLYFSFDSGQGEYMPALFKLDTKELTVLKGVKDAFAIAYDAAGRQMYFGGTHGIYKFDTNLKSLKRLNINHLDIWWLHVKKEIYFIKFPSLSTYSFQNGTLKSFPDLTDNVVHQIVLDMDDNKFFINNSGLYGIKPFGKQALLLRDSPRFINMATDNEGYVHACSEDGIYIVSRMVQKVKKMMSIRGVLGFTFDNTNRLIYSDSHEIVRLLPIAKVG